MFLLKEARALINTILAALPLDTILTSNGRDIKRRDVNEDSFFLERFKGEYFTLVVVFLDETRTKRIGVIHHPISVVRQKTLPSVAYTSLLCATKQIVLEGEIGFVRGYELPADIEKATLLAMVESINTIDDNLITEVEEFTKLLPTFDRLKLLTLIEGYERLKTNMDKINKLSIY